MLLLNKNVGLNKVIQYADKKWLTPDKIYKSWSTPLLFVEENEELGKKGLRKAQLGAVYSIKSHWTVSNEHATIVMPTGTGKTETMIATIISENCKKTLIIVPSKLLRDQTVEKCASLSLLRDIGIIPKKILNPSVGCIQVTPKDIKELEKIINESNIIVSTVALLKNFNQDYIDILAKYISMLIIDEAHHIAARTWSDIKINFSNTRCLQFTATPFRNDGKKIDGKIIYNFPLFKAQKQGYFQPINFFPIYEFNEKKADLEVAKKSVLILEEDIKKGFPHILLVRAKDKERANNLFNDIYLKEFSKYNPVLIISGQGEKLKKEYLSQIKSLKSRILICVDMFKEGIDIPNLKIAAMHDKYKSLPITLQFIGRFARTKKGLGNASLVANIANEEVSESLSELYTQDSDWNEMLSLISDKEIGKELSLQELSQGFTGTGVEGIRINQLIPKVSMIAYKTKSKKWAWQNWSEVFDEEKCKFYLNEEKKLLIIIEMLEEKVDWTNYKDVRNVNWNLHLLYWNEKKKMFFINTSDRAIANILAEKIFDDYKKVTGEEVFRCLFGINHLMFATVGLNSAIDGPIRYKMYAGIDIAQGLSEAQKTNCIKSNLFGIGYNGKGKVSIGCSHKGVIWSKWVETIDYWINWCNENAEKILNNTIDISNILEGALAPVVIKSRPKSVPYKINWPIEFDLRSEDFIRIVLPTKVIPIYEVDIGLIQLTDEGPLSYYIGNNEFREEYELIIEQNKYYVKKTKSSFANIQIGRNKIVSLETFFNDYPPTIKFVDQSSLEGNLLVNIKMSITSFDRNKITRWLWKGINIRKESQGDSKEKDSIQYKVIEELQHNLEYSIIFNDDNAGEIADVVTIKEKDNTIYFEFYHCKFSKDDNPGSRIEDLYEVCGQAEKSVLWMQDVRRIIDRMIKRENIKVSAGKPSRFEKGDINKLVELKNKMRIYPSKAAIYIVQPGINADAISLSMEQILCGSASYLMDTYSIPLTLICS